MFSLLLNFWIFKCVNIVNFQSLPAQKKMSPICFESVYWKLHFFNFLNRLGLDA